MFYTQLGLKIGPRSLYLLYLSSRPNGIVKIKLKDITFQNFMKCPWSSKMKKNNGFLTSLSFSLSLSLSFYSLYLSLTEKSTIPPSVPCLHFFSSIGWKWLNLSHPKWKKKKISKKILPGTFPSGSLPHSASFSPFSPLICSLALFSSISRILHKPTSSAHPFPAPP